MVLAQAPGYRPGAANLKSREWFRDARFGLFVHWGVYSVLGDGEWVMNNQQIPAKTYEKIPAFFNPTDFDPKAWVQMAKDAGMKYITITLALAGATLLAAYADETSAFGFASVTVQLLSIVGLLFAGGLLLLWVCWKMWRELRSGHELEAAASQEALAGRIRDCHAKVLITADEGRRAGRSIRYTAQAVTKPMPEANRNSMLMQRSRKIERARGFRARQSPAPRWSTASRPRR